jgi:peptidoglycan-associated lipoprotein
MVMMAFVLALGTGCAKKQMSAEPAPAATQPADSSSADDAQRIKEQELAAEKQAMVAAEQAITGNKIYFDFDKYDLKPEAKKLLTAKAELLKKYSSWKLLIEGHCDNRGTEEYNLALGERRARAAYEFLVVLGVPSSRLKVVSYGEERPAVDENNETAWAMNRRDEFKLFK